MRITQLFVHVETTEVVRKPFDREPQRVAEASATNPTFFPSLEYVNPATTS